MGSPQNRARLHRLYYLLALFNLVTVAASLSLGHEMIDSVKASVQANRVSQQRFQRYAQLGRLAQQVNAPGNDVFVDRAIDQQEQRLAAAVAAFQEAIEAERRDGAGLPAAAGRALAHDLDDLEAAVHLMAAGATGVFARFRSGQIELAGQAMAAMDRQYASVTDALQRLGDEAMRQQGQLLDGQERAADDRRWYELAIGCAVLIMVAAAGLYGQQVSGRMQRVERERLEHLMALETAQAELREQALELERRVDQRTAQLAGANAELSRVASIVDATDIGVYSIGADDTVLSWSPAAERMLGYPGDEIIGKPVGQLIPEALQAEAHQLHSTARGGDRTERTETQRRHRDGTLRHVSIRFTPVSGPDGPATSIGAIIRDITDQVVQRDRVVESERRMAEAQQLANIGSWAWDLQANAVSWSDQQYRILGLEPGSVVPSYQAFFESLHADDREPAQKSIEQGLASGEPFELHHRVVLADGQVRYVETKSRATRDESGAVVGLTGTSQDVTAARAAERARRTAEDLFRAYVENTSEWVWALDIRGHITYSNRAVFDILGYEPEELIGRDVRPLVEPVARAATEKLLPEVVAGRQRWNGIVRRFLHKNGEWRHLESSGMPIADERGRVIGFRGAERDITRRKLAEEALRRSEERFQLAARATSDVLWDFDFSTRVIWRNDGIRRLFGHDDGVERIESWGALLHPDDRAGVQARLDAFLDSDRETWTDEYRFRRSDGTYAWVLDRGFAVRDGGKPVRMIGSMIDITERKEAERMKSDFVSFVSHQLRTPLSGMNWMLELAAEAENLPAQASDYIGEARASAARLVTLVNDLLDIARLESGRTVMARESVPLAEITRSVLREMQAVIADKRHEVRFEADRAPAALGDAQMLRQVITNLLSNAVKYTPDGGAIEVQLVRRRDAVEWSVRDNGMGIPRAAQARLFEKFYRADNAISRESEGTGLGLHLVRLVVEHAGGQIWCESEEGEGARFAFTLPVAQQQGAEV